MKTLFAAGILIALALPHAHSRAGVEQLGAIVGEWQSDTTGGVSARSTCVWTPNHGAVLCEQRIEGAGKTTSAINLFTSDPTTLAFALYVVPQTGGSIPAVPLMIRGTEWFYGGGTQANDGRYYRTVNDFSQSDVYRWRQESSADGKTWIAGMHGLSRRIK